MAQTFALENDLDGYGQNSLPIAVGTILNDTFSAGRFSEQLDSWRNAGHTFSEVNTKGDPATLYYSVIRKEAYLDSSLRIS